MTITLNMHTQRTNTTPWIWIEALSINSNLCTWVFSTTTLCSLLSSLCSILTIILQLYNEGVYILFPSYALKLSNLELNSIYLHSLHIKAPIYYGRERIAQGPFTIIQACLHLMTSLIFQNIFKKCDRCFSNCLLSPCWLTWDAPASLQPWGSTWRATYHRKQHDVYYPSMGVVSACTLSFMSKYLHQSCVPKPMTRVDINDNNQSSNRFLRCLVFHILWEIVASIMIVEIR